MPDDTSRRRALLTVALITALLPRAGAQQMPSGYDRQNAPVRPQEAPRMICKAVALIFALGLLAAPLAAEAQQAGKVYRLGILHPTDRGRTEGIRTDLRDLGYVEGQNLVVEPRYAEGKLDRLPKMARELVQLRVDVIFAVGSAAIRAAKDATTTIPIVMYGGVDPVAAGFVTSLARPGGNITGVLILPGSTLAGKKLELLKEAVPRVAGIALLAPDDPTFPPHLRETQKAAASLGIKLVVVEVRGGDYDRAFAAMAAERPGALLVASNPIFMRDRKRIIDLAAKHRLPAIYEWPEQVEDGGLMSYGSSQPALRQRAATYIDRIFKGAKPADLPVEQPTRFELVINLKTAKALGLTIPQTVLRRADHVIE
jgi:putative ABC transport system substrate-binding protein